MIMNVSSADVNDVQEISLTNGTCIWWGRMDARQQPMRLPVQRKHLVIMHFTLAGSVAAHLGDSTLSINLPTNQHNLLCTSGTACWLTVFPEQPCEFVQIHVVSEFFAQFSEPDSPTLQHLAKLVQTHQPLYLVPANLPVTPAMHTVLAQITKCPLTCSLKQLFLEAKVLELFALQLGQYEQHLSAAAATAQPPEYDKIVEARRLLETHFDNPPTLADLSRLVGLNEFKLKKSFKEVFGDTIYGWVLNYRLERAYQLLQRHQLTISEVAYRVGYQHPAHFTTAFKKKFGIVPSAVE